MTNTPRTRAEIQAEIEKLQAEMKTAPKSRWKVGDRVGCVGTIEEIDRYAYVKVPNNVGRILLDIPALIPAADLIPRAEHEAALFAANTRTDKVVLHLNARDAIRYLVKEYALDAPGEPRSYLHYHDGLEYRVTVERVDHIRDATKKVEHTDAEPVGWVADRGEAGLSSVLLDSEGQATRFNDGGPAVPLYRHPAPPQGTAVAPQGVVEEIKNAINDLIYSTSTERRVENLECIKAALARVTELPEPSEWARVYINTNYRLKRSTPDERRDFAAALLERAKETE